MPRRNGMGPNGAGSLTGRGLGSCNENQAKRMLNRNGLGGRRSMRRRFNRNFACNRFNNASLEANQNSQEK